MSLAYISQQTIVYSGIGFLLFGVLGNTINIYIFSSVSIYRRTPASFYFLIDSIFKNVYLLVNLTPRVIGHIYGYDFANISLLWCKFRQSILIMSAAISLTLTTLCVIDQYLVTSSNPSIRRLSRIQVSYRVVIIAVIVWFLHAIPFFVFYGISPTTKTCASMNSILANYISIFFLAILCIIPISLICFFGYLTYENIRRTIALAEQHADRQLIKMTFSQVIFAFFYSTPLGILYLYSAITSSVVKDPDRMLKEYFAYMIISTEITFYYASSFYVFLFSSSRFRRNVTQRLFGERSRNKIRPKISRSMT
ncbi:unnamed protein product [Adineta ricciae]|uniref:G-protein coupled receptors family 1 profile domain-containing protein n=1 Tax=Adineta ricciae TaxID=249248 RepID=A0A814KSJ6_ADIRI|nr:unnamed protein product [Adineta ricciae]CAF1418790.1 unnamed protein product [Adineta ricciae]